MKTLPRLLEKDLKELENIGVDKFKVTGRVSTDATVVCDLCEYLIRKEYREEVYRHFLILLNND